MTTSLRSLPLSNHKKIVSILLTVISVFLFGCKIDGIVGSSGNHSRNANENDQVSGQVRIEQPLVGATVKIYSISDTQFPFGETQKASPILRLESDDAGTVSFNPVTLDDNIFYLVEVGGGQENGTAIYNTLHLIALGKDLKTRDWSVNPATEWAYQYAIYYFRANYENTEISDQLDFLAQQYLEKDINNDGAIDQFDLYAFNAADAQNEVYDPLAYQKLITGLRGTEKIENIVSLTGLVTLDSSIIEDDISGGAPLTIFGAYNNTIVTGDGNVYERTSDKKWVWRKLIPGVPTNTPTPHINQKFMVNNFLIEVDTDNSVTNFSSYYFDITGNSTTVSSFANETTQVAGIEPVLNRIFYRGESGCRYHDLAPPQAQGALDCASTSIPTPISAGALVTVDDLKLQLPTEFPPGANTSELHRLDDSLLLIYLSNATDLQVRRILFYKKQNDAWIYANSFDGGNTGGLPYEYNDLIYLPNSGLVFSNSTLALIGKIKSRLVGRNLDPNPPPHASTLFGTNIFFLDLLRNESFAPQRHKWEQVKIVVPPEHKKGRYTDFTEKSEIIGIASKNNAISLLSPSLNTYTNCDLNPCLQNANIPPDFVSSSAIQLNDYLIANGPAAVPDQYELRFIKLNDDGSLNPLNIGNFSVTREKPIEIFSPISATLKIVSNNAITLKEDDTTIYALGTNGWEKIGIASLGCGSDSLLFVYENKAYFSDPNKKPPTSLCISTIVNPAATTTEISTDQQAYFNAFNPSSSYSSIELNGNIYTQFQTYSNFYNTSTISAFSLNDILNPKYMASLGNNGLFLVEDTIPTTAGRILELDNTIYLIDSDVGIKVFDISNLSAPKRVGIIPLPGGPIGIVKQNDNAIVAVNGIGTTVKIKPYHPAK